MKCSSKAPYSGILGGLLGLALATTGDCASWWRRVSQTLPRLNEIGLDPVVPRFRPHQVSLLSGLLFGLDPRPGSTQGLRWLHRFVASGEASVTGLHSIGCAIRWWSRRWKAWRSLLLVGAVLMIRTFQALRSVSIRASQAAFEEVQLLRILILPSRAGKRTRTSDAGAEPDAGQTGGDSGASHRLRLRATLPSKGSPTATFSMRKTRPTAPARCTPGRQFRVRHTGVLQDHRDTFDRRTRLHPRAISTTSAASRSFPRTFESATRGVTRAPLLSASESAAAFRTIPGKRWWAWWRTSTIQDLQEKAAGVCLLARDDAENSSRATP